MNIITKIKTAYNSYIITKECNRIERHRKKIAYVLNLPEDIISYNDGLWDIDGDVGVFNDLGFLVRDGRLIIKFGKISGDMYCYHKLLHSLEGFPHTVGGDLNLKLNRLRTLEGCPEYIGGSFYCGGNPFDMPIVGGPKYVGGEYKLPSNMTLYKNNFNYFKKVSYNI